MRDIIAPGFLINISANSQDGRLSELKQKPRAVAGQPLLQLNETNKRVLKFEFEDHEKKLDILKLKLDNGDLELLDHPAFVRGNSVQFVFGYEGRFFGPRVHMIDSIKGFKVLNIIATERTALSNEVRKRIFKNKKRVDVVRQIIAEGKYPEVDTVNIDESSLANEKARDWSQSETDWKFLKRLAEKVNYQVYIEGNVLHFHPRKLDSSPLENYFWRGGNGELLDFDIKEHRATNRAGEIEVKAFDPIEKKVVSSKGSDKDTKRTTLGNQGSVQIIGSLQTGRVIVGKKVIPTPDKDPATVKKEADTHYQKNEELEIEAMATIIGNPLLPAKSIIDIQGVSENLSGKYYIKSHNHTIDMSGGYKGRLELIRNAISNNPTQDKPTLDKTKASENKKKKAGERETVIKGSTATGTLRVVRKR